MFRRSRNGGRLTARELTMRLLNMVLTQLKFADKGGGQNESLIDTWGKRDPMEDENP